VVDHTTYKHLLPIDKKGFKNTQKCINKSTGINSALYNVIKLTKIIEANWLYLYAFDFF